MNFIASMEVKFCAASASIWQLIGYVLLVFKIVIPILLIIFGMIDLGKAVISSDDKAVTKAATALMKRVIAGVIIFFIPMIIGLVFSMVGGFKEAENQYKICKKCIVSPTSKDCNDYVDKQDDVKIVDDK